MERLLNQATNLIAEWERQGYHTRWELIAPLQETLRQIVPLLPESVGNQVRSLVFGLQPSQIHSCKQAVELIQAI